MSNECRRVITLHALTENGRIMQEGAWSLYIYFLQNHNTQEGTGKLIYKPSVLDEKQLHLK